VLLTTNYLDEAEALCDRVAILREGKLLAEDTPAALTARTGRCLELQCREESALQIKEALRNHQGILRVETADFGLRAYLTIGVNPEDVVHEARGICSFDGFRTRSPDLAEVFRSLTTATAPA
jgi:ABC-2 type transport system ATP-binding protein